MDAEDRGRELAAQLTRRTEERDALRADGERLTGELATERTRLEKARSRWGEDRVSLERARQALAAVMAQIQETEARPME